MGDTLNDFGAPTFVLPSAMDDDLNLLRINPNDDDRQKPGTFRCSLNEFPDPYASEAFLTSIKADILAKHRESNFYYFRRTGVDSWRNLPGASIANFDRSDFFTPLDRIGSMCNEPPTLADPQTSLSKRGSFCQLNRPTYNQGSQLFKENKENSESRSSIFKDSVRRSRSKRLFLGQKSSIGIKQRQPVQCNCKKSKCLRLYCECFAKGLICGVDCNCTDCHNNTALEDLRGLVVQETLEKNPFAFKSKYKPLQTDDHKVLHSRGCNCSKTGCVKKYCECYNAGTGCSRLCRCSNCKNESIEIRDEEVKVYYDRVLRKRRKKSMAGECLERKIEIIKRLKQDL